MMGEVVSIIQDCCHWVDLYQISFGCCFDLVFVFIFWDRASLCIPSWHQTFDPLVSVSQVLTCPNMSSTFKFPLKTPWLHSSVSPPYHQFASVNSSNWSSKIFGEKNLTCTENMFIYLSLFPEQHSITTTYMALLHGHVLVKIRIFLFILGL